MQRIFRFVWRDGRLPDLPIEWAELVHDVGLADANARIADPEVKAALRANTDEAISRGVFGVPTLAIGDALFWGADATDMAVDYLRGTLRLDDGEYARVAALPQGATREPRGRRRASPRASREQRGPRGSGRHPHDCRAARQRAIVASSKPASRSSSAECSPCAGAGRPGTNAWPSMRAGGAMSMRPPSPRAPCRARETADRRARPRGPAPA